MRCGTSQKIIINKNSRMPEDFPSFMKDPDSKSQLFQLMLGILDDDQSANSVEKLQGKKFIIVVEGKAVQLSSDGFSPSKEDID